MKIRMIKDADVNLVEIKDGTPHCKIHGAMNKLTAEGIWRCVSTYEYDCSNPRNIIFKGNICKAGCEEILG